MVLFIWLGLCLLLERSLAYPTYQEQIPNGNRVPHPCKVNYMWPGVGHKNAQGGGDRNPFGIDFKNFNKQWGKALCEKDSDGDGKSNGEELGDPKCIWTPGQLPARTVNISHPGVCDPYVSQACKDKNSFLSCSLDAFQGCEAIKNPNVTQLDLRFKQFLVPASQTNYMCMTFDLPNDKDYHIIANEPLINNSNVLHHMILYACNDGDNTLLETPTPCRMSSGACSVMISTWTVGLTGQCFGPKSGYRIGKSNFKRVRLEVHYNNPEKVSTYYDASGLRLYIQDALPGVQDMATFMTGQTILQIPPGQKAVEHVGVCPGGCTNMLLNKPVYVPFAGNHMHYLGRSMKMELFRNGTMIANLTNDAFYSYDSPVSHIHDPPIEIRPGDQITTTCVYNSLSNDHYVFYGEETTDEMCFGFLYTYPMDSYSSSLECVSQGPVSECDAMTRAPVAGCDWASFLNFSGTNTAAIYSNLATRCSLEGLCRPECREYLKTLQANPCLIGEASIYVKKRMTKTKEGVQFLGWLNSCKLDQEESLQSLDSSDGANKMSPTYALTALLAIFIFKCI